jgi:hypothetical protein
VPTPSFTERYPTLKQLFSASFHQDWTLESPTTTVAVRRFVRDEGAPVARRAAAELKQLLAEIPQDSELGSALDDFGCYYTPAANGVTYRKWLTRVGELLLAAG